MEQAPQQIAWAISIDWSEYKKIVKLTEFIKSIHGVVGKAARSNSNNSHNNTNISNQYTLEENFQFASKFITNFKKIMKISDLNKIIVFEESSPIDQHENFHKKRSKENFLSWRGNNREENVDPGMFNLPSKKTNYIIISLHCLIFCFFCHTSRFKSHAIITPK